MSVHIVIKTERRKDRLAISINNDLVTPTGKTIKTPMGDQPEMLRTPRPAQLHTQGTAINDWSNIEYAAEWDEHSPWIVLLTGDRGTLKHQFMGWPTLTEEELKADPVKPMGAP